MQVCINDIFSSTCDIRWAERSEEGGGGDSSNNSSDREKKRKKVREYAIVWNREPLAGNLMFFVFRGITTDTFFS